jgi:hypothetical protein
MEKPDLHLLAQWLDSTLVAVLQSRPRWPLQNAPLVARSKYPTLGDSRGINY